MKLFGYFPDRLFQPLAAPNRHIYARLLLRLYDRVFAARILEIPTREEILHQISLALPEEGVSSAEQLGEESSGEEEGKQAHYLAYRRLCDTGWLFEEREKWRTYVEMHPDAFMLIGSIAELSDSRLRVAGAVVEVKSSLEAAAKDPDAMAQGLANAHDTSVRFARGMRRILVGMRDIEDAILGNANAASILRTFFEEFVDGLLIADYKQLKTSNNPYRYRRQISALAGELLHDTDKRTRISLAYIEQGVVPSGTTMVAAEEKVVNELERIRQVFEDVGAFMERIDSFRDRLERRIRTTVRYMDMVGEGSVERLARVIERLAACGSSEVEMRIPTPDTGLPITEKALYTPPPARSAPEKTRFRVPKNDPYLRRYMAAIAAFDKMVHVSTPRLLKFIDSNMAGRERVSSSEMHVGTIEELFAFRNLPGMAAHGQPATIGNYRIVLEDGRTGNEWIDLKAFRVERIAGGADTSC